ncbi:MAG: hypothetical protein GWO04_17620, partial [Actinobacteria bacterium]|nr:hypothetical protein [Actinomycetota bacterium]
VEEESERIEMGWIGPEGIARVSLGVPVSRETLTLTVRGVDSARVSSSSAPIAVTPDGTEVWAAFPDGDVVSIIDAATDARLAQVAIDGRPS